MKRIWTRVTKSSIAVTLLITTGIFLVSSAILILIGNTYYGSILWWAGVACGLLGLGVAYLDTAQGIKRDTDKEKLC